MHHILGAFVIGAIGGGVAGNSRRLRPTLRTIVKVGIVAKRRAEAAGAAVAAETRKIVNEAQADLDRSETELNS